MYAKDVILTIIGRLGIKGGAGFAYEYAGDTIDRMSMDERMTICNMSIEGGARVGYVNPDDTTFEYLRGRRFAPQGAAFDRACAWWRSIASDRDAAWDDVVKLDAASDRADRHVGHQSRAIGADRPAAARSGLGAPSRTAPEWTKRFEFMGLRPGQPMTGTRIDVAFIGSCTNARLSDLREAAHVVSGHHVAPHVRALVVPGIAGRARCRRTRRSRRHFSQRGIRLA